jgi:hypothetical protein
MKRILVLSFITLLSACGGAPTPPSNVDASRKLTSLNANEREEVCAWGVAELGGDGKQYTCNGDTITIHSVDDCVSGMNHIGAECAATVGELEACTKGQASAFKSCSSDLPSECNAVAACAPTS